MSDNERIQHIKARCEKIGQYTSPEFDLLWLISVIEQRDKTIAELSGVYVEQYGAELQRRIQIILSTLEQLSVCVDAFMKDCKTQHMNIPYNVYHGTYMDLKTAYVRASNVMTEAKVTPFSEV